MMTARGQFYAEFGRKNSAPTYGRIAGDSNSKVVRHCAMYYTAVKQRRRSVEPNPEPEAIGTSKLPERRSPELFDLRVSTPPL
jgi:hypothetical protein